MTGALTRVECAGLGFPESPRWHDGRLYFSDFWQRRVCSLGPGGEVSTVLSLDDAPSGLGWSPGGELLVVTMTERAVRRMEGPSGTALVADLGPVTEVAANDMVVDERGGAYVSGFGFDLVAGATPRPSALARVGPDGAVSVAAADLWFPNGIVLSPDGRLLVVAETFAHRLTAFDVGADGRLSGRRLFAELDPSVSPDGICLDAAGQVWVAAASSGRVLRVADGGEVTEEVGTGSGQRAYACMLGGPDRRTLFVCTAPTFRPSDRREGRIESVPVSTPGAGRP